MSLERSTTVQAAIDPHLERGARWAGTIALGVALVTAAAHLAVPIPGTPVPVTFQDLAVLVVGIVLGPTRGAATLVAYVGIGALGAPVFSNGHGGLPWLLGPTGGYLLAYPAAAWLAGMGAVGGWRELGWARSLAGILAAQAAIFTGGATQLAVLQSFDASAAWAMAVAPFLPGAALKAALALGFARVRAMRDPRS